MPQHLADTLPALADMPLPERPTVPGFEILEELGRGGMGVVYKARQTSPERLVALKLIRDGALAAPLDRARFQIEAEAASRLEHPHVVQVFEVGQHAGHSFFAMEFAAGGSLDRRLAGRPQPARDAAALIHALALAIQHAHQRKIVHRDLKPANILLFPRSELSTPPPEVAEVRRASFDLDRWTPKVADFGLAKRIDSQTTAFTQDGAVLGTAGYMAPEQAAGHSRDIGPEADVYSLGAILYELLTGRPPFQGESWHQTVEQVLRKQPEPPTRLRPDVPGELETVCLKCLEKEPERRYASARELADELHRFLEGEPIRAVPLSESERIARLAAADGFQIDRLIGRGPRSAVYHALSGPLRQPVALKVFAAGCCPREHWEARLRRGMETWATLAHPQVIAVQRAGWWDASPYLSLEYVPQGSLAARLAGRPLPLREALLLVEQLAEVVVYLHRQGAVHANLKPGNVLLAADGIPRIADDRFTGGLFLAMPATDDRDPTGMAYLAPELLRDADAEPRPYTDIYGLGAILYEALTGRPPFSAPSSREMAEQVQSHDPPPPSRYNAHVPPPVDAACLRCLRKNPWRRYRRAYDLLARLRSLRESEDGSGLAGMR